MEAAIVGLYQLSGRLRALHVAAAALSESPLFLRDFRSLLELEVAGPREGGRAAPTSFAHLALDGVTFRYPGAARPAVEDVSLEVGAGEVAALVGENGSGKTTLPKLVAGLYVFALQARAYVRADARSTVTADDVIELLDRLDAAGIDYCVEGGWGVDALLGEQTRPHDDLDLGVDAADVERLRAALPEFEPDGREWPSSLVLRDARGRKVDAHPLAYDERGDGWQANLSGGEAYRWPREHLRARGRVLGRPVRCITAELQLRWHAYEGVDDVDWADMRALCERFGLPVPDRLQERPGFVDPKRRLQHDPAATRVVECAPSGSNRPRGGSSTSSSSA